MLMFFERVRYYLRCEAWNLFDWIFGDILMKIQISSRISIAI